MPKGTSEMDLKFKVFKLQGPKQAILFCYFMLANFMPAKKISYIRSLISVFISNSYIHIPMDIIYHAVYTPF